MHLIGINEALFASPQSGSVRVTEAEASLIGRVGGEGMLVYLLAHCDAGALHGFKQCSPALRQAARHELCSARWCGACATGGWPCDLSPDATSRELEGSSKEPAEGARPGARPGDRLGDRSGDRPGDRSPDAAPGAAADATADVAAEDWCAGWTVPPETLGQGIDLRALTSNLRFHSSASFEAERPAALRLAAALYLLADSSSLVEEADVSSVAAVGSAPTRVQERIGCIIGTGLVRGGAPRLRSLSFSLDGSSLEVHQLRPGAQTRQVDVTNCGLGEAGLIVLLSLLRAGGGEALQELKLGGNGARQTSMLLLAAMMSAARLPSLQTLDIGCDDDEGVSAPRHGTGMANRPTETAVAALIAAIVSAACSALLEVRLSTRALDLRQMAPSSVARQLDLSCAGVTDHDVALLAAKGRRGGAPDLVSLSLDSCALHCSSAVALADAISAGAFPRLRRLSLFGNRIETCAASRLLHAFQAAAAQDAKGHEGGEGGTRPSPPVEKREPPRQLCLLGNPLDVERLRGSLSELREVQLVT